MNNIIIIDSIVVIVVMIEIEQVESGSFQNQTESPLARRLPRKAGRQGPPLWEGLNTFINVHVCMYSYCNSNRNPLAQLDVASTFSMRVS